MLRPLPIRVVPVDAAYPTKPACSARSPFGRAIAGDPILPGAGQSTRAFRALTAERRWPDIAAAAM